MLGHSPGGRPIDLLTIAGKTSAAQGTEARPRGAIWVVFRQHPWETYSSYAAEGFIDWLLARDGSEDQTVWQHVWQVVPMVNVDGCFHGHTRHNMLRKDPNREWNAAEPAPEVACIRQAIFDKLGGGPVFFLDVHNNNQQTVDFLALSNTSFGATPEEAAERLERHETLITRIAGALAARSHFEGTVRQVDRPARWGSPAAPPSLTPGERAGKPFAFPSALLEMRTGPLPTRGGAYGTIGDQRRFGAALAESIALALEKFTWFRE